MSSFYSNPLIEKEKAIIYDDIPSVAHGRTWTKKWQKPHAKPHAEAKKTHELT